MELIHYADQFSDILLSSIPQLTNIKPSEWVEQNIIMGKPFPGPFRYTKTPYCRKIIDCLAPDHPARSLAVMKGAQLGFSAGVLIPGIGYVIANQPGNGYLTVGAPDLVPKAMEKIDLMIDGASLRKFIKPNVTRNRNQKTGDTNTTKEFPGGFFSVISAGNHKAIRQVDLQYGFFDDWESVKGSSKESGDTKELLDQRFAAYADTCKKLYISTPELDSESNIKPIYLEGDQQRYFIPCPCCHEPITLEWSIQLDDKDFNGGIYWEVDEYGLLNTKSVGYICQKCGGYFNDKRKHQFLNDADWIPTAMSKSPTHFSFQISSLYAPLGMYDWAYYVQKWMDAHPVGQPRNEKKFQTIQNVVLGLTYVGEADAPKATALLKNIRDYEIGIIPESLSESDGNGKIVLVTCGADMNGTRDDARLDYEIVAHAENGTIYSITHGSIGTFVYGESKKENAPDRVKWTYQENLPNSVWPEFEKVLQQLFKTDTDREMPIVLTGLDTGYCTTDANAFIDRTNCNIVGLKGQGEDEKVKIGADKRIFRQSTESQTLYLVQVGIVKDKLAEYMNLRWAGEGSPQPGNFMNFPQPGGGLYGFTNYFEHFEAEERILEKNKNDKGVAIRWKKKNSKVQNHLWDCRIYNIAIRDIFVDKVGKAYKQKLSFADYAALVAPHL